MKEDDFNITLKLFNLIKNHEWEKFTQYIKSEQHIDLNVRDDQNNYLLTYAVLYNQSQIVKLLIEKGARIDIVDNEGRSLLYISIRYDYQTIIDILLEYNKNNIGISIFDIRDKSKHVPIHYAVNYNNIDALQKILKAGANANATDANGYNALHLAVYARSLKMCEIITQYNIDINAQYNTGETALHISSNLQLIEITKLLIASGINVNIQDYDHEYTALHYSVNLNDRELINILLENSADPNIQDVVGNTVIHYAISENNLESLVLIVKNQYATVNLNLWNFDGKIPLLIALDIEPYNLVAYIDLLLDASNINIQDNNGDTCLHIFCKKNLWQEYKNNLIKKKLDIYLPNNENMRPIDYISENELDEFLDMVVDSYINRLRRASISDVWSTEWENICKKELYISTLTGDERREIPIDLSTVDEKTDICRTIIKDKLFQLKNENNICTKSYPLHRGYMCLNLAEGRDLNVCTFTGSTLDILIGLIYLLKKHPNACTTFSRNFTENKELCRFYKSIGILMNTRCEFLNFEIVWVHQRLYMMENFYDNLKKCINRPDKRFIIIPIGIELREGSHANYLLYDKQTKQVERFEPHGYNPPSGFDYKANLLDDVLESRFSEVDNAIKYIRPKEYLPRISFQLLDVYERRKKKIGDPGGFCALWAIWYIDMRLTYQDLDRKTLVENMIKTIKSQNISFKNLIRNYAQNILDIRDTILKAADLDINAWMNDQYTEHQVDIVLKALTQEVTSVLP